MKRILRKHKKRTYVSFILITVILLLLLKFIGWDEIYQAFGSVKPFFVSIAFLISLLIIFLKSGVWHGLLRKLGYPIKYYKTVILVYATGFLLTAIPLGALGSRPFSAYLLHKNSGIPVEKGLAAIIAADILRWSSVYFLAWIGFILFMISTTFSYVTLSLLIIAVIAGSVLAIAFLILWEKERWLDKIAIFAGTLVSKIRSLFKGKSKTWQKHFQKDIEMEIHIFEKTLHKILKNTTNLTIAITLSCLEWFSTVALLYILLYSLGITSPWYILLLIISLSHISALLPIPGGFGGAEITIGGLLILLLGISAPQAAVAAILYRVFISWIPIILGGWGVAILSKTKIEQTLPKSIIERPIIK